MPLEPLLLCYAGHAAFAVSTARVRGAAALPRLGAVAPARIAGALLLTLAFWRASVAFGPYQGPVAWTGMLCLAGAALVLLFSRLPRLALGLALPALALAVLLVALG